MSHEKPAASEVPTPADCPAVDGMPMLGFGTWQLTDPETCATAVRTALDVGYRHVDTARAYGNEGDVGDGIERSDVDRDEVFLATKIWKEDLGYDDAIEQAYEAVDDLGVESVDLLYVHWPADAYDPEETFQAFDELVDEGVTDHIGICNFEPDQIDEATAYAEHDIFAHQFECHPLLQQEAVREATEDHDLNPVAYSPLARGDVVGHDTLSEIAGDHEVSEAQISLAWLREQGLTAIPKASTEDHIRDNWRSLSVQLTEGELADIDAIDAHERKVDPRWGPWKR